MYDQWVEAWPALGLVNSRYGLGISRIRREAVDGLRRYSDWLTGEYQPRGFGNRFVIER
jgi:hypothetical protein